MKKFTGALFILVVSFLIVNFAFAGQRGRIVGKGKDAQKRPQINSRESSSQRKPRAVIDPHKRRRAVKYSHDKPRRVIDPHDNPRAVIDPHEKPRVRDQYGNFKADPSLRKNQVQEAVQNQGSEDSEIESMRLNNIQSKRQQAMQRASQTSKSLHESATGIIDNLK